MLTISFNLYMDYQLLKKVNNLIKKEVQKIKK